MQIPSFLSIVDYQNSIWTENKGDGSLKHVVCNIEFLSFNGTAFYKLYSFTLSLVKANLLQMAWWDGQIFRKKLLC